MPRPLRRVGVPRRSAGLPREPREPPADAARSRRADVPNLEYHRFFTALSERPGSLRAMTAHLLPSSSCSLHSWASSSAVKGVCFSVGSRWLTQRSRHCLPMRPGNCFAMAAHEGGPLLSDTNLRMRASSSGVHDPLMVAVPCIMFACLCRHSTSLRRPSRYSSEIRFHLFSLPSAATPRRKHSSSSLLQAFLRLPREVAAVPLDLGRRVGALRLLSGLCAEAGALKASRAETASLLSMALVLSALQPS